MYAYVIFFRSVNPLADQSKQKAVQAELFAHLKNRASKWWRDKNSLKYRGTVPYTDIIFSLHDRSKTFEHCYIATVFLLKW